jgi:uncharacterized protein YeaO (DUF488 family)
MRSGSRRSPRARSCANGSTIAADRWQQFCKRYAAELDRNPDAVAKLRDLCTRGRVTLLYSARDLEHNQARALLEYLEAAR